MKVKSIIIELEPEGRELELGHATKIMFQEGMWTANGPIFSRFGAALHECWRLLKGEK